MQLARGQTMGPSPTSDSKAMDQRDSLCAHARGSSCYLPGSLMAISLWAIEKLGHLMLVAVGKDHICVFSKTKAGKNLLFWGFFSFFFRCHPL